MTADVLRRVRDQAGYDVGWSCACQHDECGWIGDLTDTPSAAVAALATHQTTHRPPAKD